MLRFFSLVSLCLCACFATRAQIIEDPNEILSWTLKAEVRLELMDGNSYTGELFKMNGKYIAIIRTEDGEEIILPRELVKKLVVIGLMKSSQVKAPHSDYYFVSPSAIPSKKGEVYFRNQMLVVNSLRVGITDHISVGAGLELGSLLSGGDINNYQANLKISHEVLPRLYLGVGYLAIFRFRPGSRRSKTYHVHVPHFLMTVGTKKTNLTVRVDYSNAQDPFQFAFTGGAAAKLGLSRRMSFMVEGVLAPLNRTKRGVFATAGFQFTERKSTIFVGILTQTTGSTGGRSIDLAPIPGFGATFTF